MIKNIVLFIALKVVKVSGLLYLLMLYYINFATGQAEISYRFAHDAQLIGLLAIIAARFEETPLPTLLAKFKKDK